MTRKLATIGPCAGPEVARLVANTINRLRRNDVLGIAFVVVAAQGAVATSFAGHRSGQYHQLNSGIALLRKRFDAEADA